MLLSLDSMADQINRLSVGEQTNVQTSTQDIFSKVFPAIEQGLTDMLDDKTVLSQAHLTESSSSGSVTDSICTTYEQSNNSSPLIKSLTHQLDSSPATPSGGVSKRSPTKQVVEAAVATPNKADASMISSMFGGEKQRVKSIIYLLF